MNIDLLQLNEEDKKSWEFIIDMTFHCSFEDYIKSEHIVYDREGIEDFYFEKSQTIPPFQYYLDIDEIIGDEIELRRNLAMVTIKYEGKDMYYYFFSPDKEEWWNV